MPTIDPDEPRFVSITEREAPEAQQELPLIFDPAHVSALEAKGEGRYALHLVGGQTIQIKPPVSAAVLKRLGLTSTRGEAQRPAKDPERKAKAKAEAKRARPKRRAAPVVKQTAKKPAGWMDWVLGGG